MSAQKLNQGLSHMLGGQLLMPDRLLSPLTVSLLLLSVVKHYVQVLVHQMGWFLGHLSLPFRANLLSEWEMDVLMVEKLCRVGRR